MVAILGITLLEPRSRVSWVVVFQQHGGETSEGAALHSAWILDTQRPIFVRNPNVRFVVEYSDQELCMDIESLHACRMSMGGSYQRGVFGPGLSGPV
jgi:hypothetical protein